MGQNAKLLSYLAQHGSITTLEANRLGITRLAARIPELDKRGWGFYHESHVKVPTRHGWAYVTRYHLISEPKKAAAGNGGQNTGPTDSQESPAGERCQFAAPFQPGQGASLTRADSQAAQPRPNVYSTGDIRSAVPVTQNRAGEIAP